MASHTSQPERFRPCSTSVRPIIPGLVVRVVDHDDPSVDAVEVGAPGVAIRVEDERLQPADDRALRQPDRQAGRRRRHRVLEVRAGDAGERDGHVDEGTSGCVS
jgi:hypothetical protein